MAEQPSSFRRISPGEPVAWQQPALSGRGIQRPPLPRHDPAPAEPPPPPARPRMHWRFVAFGSVIGVLTAAIIGMGAVLAFRALLAHDDRVTAGYAPPQSVAYVALNTDRTSRAWLDAWALAEDLGIDDELADLPRRWALEQGDDPSRWDDFIKPAIGQEIGFAVWPSATGLTDPHAAAFVLVGDREAAEGALARALDDDTPTEATYRDVQYVVNAEGEAAGFIDDALVFATDTAAFEDVVDARRDGALDKEQEFIAAADRAADAPLLFVYLDVATIGTELAQRATADLPVPVPAAEFDLADWGVATITLTTEEDALRLSALTSGRPDTFPDAGDADLHAFSDEMPADALVFLAGYDLYASVWQPLAEQLRTVDQALNANGDPTAPGLDIGSMLPANLEDGLIAHLRGNYALALAVGHDGLTYAGALRFMADVDDPAAATAALDELADTLEESGAPLERTTSGFTLDAGDVTAHATLDERVLTLAASYRDYHARYTTLAEDPRFLRAVDALPEHATFAGYFAFAPFLEVLPVDPLAELDPEARAVVEALGSLAYSSGADGDGTRSDLVLLFELE